MKPIAVFVHVHYTDAWPALRNRIEHSIHLPFRMIVTGDAASQIEPPQSPHLLDWQFVETVNRGRDVLPFLQALRRGGDFDVGLKLHGKRSVHRLDGEAWGNVLASALLPSEQDVTALIARFESDLRIGLVGAPSSFCSTALHVGRNHAAIENIARRLNRSKAAFAARTPFFCAGTMFWFRSDALVSLAREDLAELFEPEAGQTDGTAAHALERLFPALCEDAGFLALPIDVALASSTATSDTLLRQATLERIDADDTFVRRPGILAAFVLQRLPQLVPVYEMLPKPVRRFVRWSAARDRGVNGS